MSLITVLRAIFWEPIADVTAREAALYVAPALIFDFFWGFALRVGVISASRLKGAVRGRWLAWRRTVLGQRLELLKQDILRGREDLGRLRQAGDYRHAEMTLRWLRQYGTRYRALAHKLAKLAPAPAYRPKVSIIVPCHNSEEVIEGTLDCLSELTYPDLEIIVVDDGSTDATSEKVARFIRPSAADGAVGPPIRLVRRYHTTGLKPAAVNFGLAFATGQVIAVVDDDTCLAPDALEWVVAPLGKPQVVACGGNIRATAPRRNLFVRLQEIEYQEAMQLGRAWQSLAFGAVFVISGAFGAFKRDYLARIGAYDVETVADDLDVTWKLYRLHGIVTFAPRAVAATKAPATLGALVRQRQRWDYGLLQTYSKQRHLVFNPRYGTVGMLLLPEVLVLELSLTLIKPFYVLALVILGADLLKVVLVTLYFYLLLEPVSILLTGLLGGQKWRALRVYYAPLMILYRTCLGALRLVTMVRYLLGKPPVRYPG